MMSDIPVLDFGQICLRKETNNWFSGNASRQLADKLYKAFSTVGFVYIKNHGIPQDKIASIFKLSDDFFQLDHDVKQKYARPASGCGHGWVAFEREKVSPDRPADHKEAFNITEPCNDQRVWPDDKVPGFQKEIHSFFELCGQLSLHILHLMALGLELKDAEIFTDTHKTMESTKNATTLRLLHYPCIKEEDGIKPGQIRCGEHTDYGSITLLFQDEMPGLEVLPLGCEDYIPAPPLPGAIVVNVADLMQRWTADKLKSTRHRVSIPTEECHRRVPRRSLAFFVHPDDDTLVECLDGSEKYPSITAYDYLWQRLNATYEY
ncbi:uncharacterized protein [Montipora foliosa]|uniref:uncharacterized protein isoform X1 n=1 Tax=Montipora foliosa TaxID=591990 RepID=UPI0035F1DCA1